MKCKHCNGGTVVLFYSSKACDKCGGSGEISEGAPPRGDASEFENARRVVMQRIRDRFCGTYGHGMLECWRRSDPDVLEYVTDLEPRDVKTLDALGLIRPGSSGPTAEVTERARDFVRWLKENP